MKMNKSMNRTKMIGLFVVLAVLVVTLASCSGSSALEKGSWRYTYDAGSYYLYSFSGGTCVISYVNTITGAQETETAKYKITGNRIVIGDDESFEWKVAGKTLILTSNGSSISLEKV